MRNHLGYDYADHLWPISLRHRGGDSFGLQYPMQCNHVPRPDQGHRPAWVCAMIPALMVPAYVITTTGAAPDVARKRYTLALMGVGRAIIIIPALQALLEKAKS